MSHHLKDKVNIITNPRPQPTALSLIDYQARKSTIPPQPLSQLESAAIVGIDSGSLYVTQVQSFPPQGRQ